MKVSSIMTERVVTVGMDDTLETIREIFCQVTFHHLLVVEDDGRLCGVISDRDLFKAVSPFIDTAAALPRDDATLNRRAHQIMSRSPICVNPDTPIADAVRILLGEKVSCLPVVSKENKLVGLVSWKDMFRSYLS